MTIREFVSNIGSMLTKPEQRRNRALRRFVRGNLRDIVQAIGKAQVVGKAQSLTGSQKIEVAAKYLAGLFDIPLLPEYLEVMMVKLAITVVVELAINVWGKREWFEQLMAAFGLDDLADADADAESILSEDE